MTTLLGGFTQVCGSGEDIPLAYYGVNLYPGAASEMYLVMKPGSTLSLRPREHALPTTDEPQYHSIICHSQSQNVLGMVELRRRKEASCMVPAGRSRQGGWVGACFECGQAGTGIEGGL